jgi:hypothetical protein
MKRRLSQPSRRLLSAAAAERAVIERERDQLLARREALHAQMGELDVELALLAERVLLIERLSGADVGSQADATTPANHPAGEDRTLLRGPAIRQTAVKILLADPRQARPLHYREWFALLEKNGYCVAGKDPLAVFLTQLSRSPVVRHGTQSGVYELDLDAVEHLRHRLTERHRQLRTLTSAPSSGTDLSGIRAQRSSLTKDIDKLEKALEEAELTLGSNAARLAAAS